MVTSGKSAHPLRICSRIGVPAALIVAAPDAESVSAPLPGTVSTNWPAVGVVAVQSPVAPGSAR